MRYSINTAVRYLEMAQDAKNTDEVLEIIDLARYELIGDPAQTVKFAGVMEALGHMSLVSHLVQDQDFVRDGLVRAIAALARETY